MRINIEVSIRDQSYKTIGDATLEVNVDKPIGSHFSELVAKMVDSAVAQAIKSQQADSPDAQPVKPQNITTENEDIPF